MTDDAATADPEDAAVHRRFAVGAFNEAWALLEQSPGPERDRAVLAAALTSRYHWERIGEPKNFAIGDWQVARVLAVLGVAELAESFGTESLRWAEEHDLGPFFTGYAHEALARAALVLGESGRAGEHLAKARAAAEQVTQEEDRELLLADVRDLERRLVGD